MANSCGATLQFVDPLASFVRVTRLRKRLPRGSRGAFGVTLILGLEFAIFEAPSRNAFYRYKNAFSQPATSQIGIWAFFGFLCSGWRDGKGSRMARSAAGQDRMARWRGSRIAHPKRFWKGGWIAHRKPFLEGGSDSALDNGFRRKIKKNRGGVG